VAAEGGARRVIVHPSPACVKGATTARFQAVPLTARHAYPVFEEQFVKHLRLIAITVSVLAALLFASSGLGTRLGLWDFRTGLAMLKWGAYVGLLGVALTATALAALALVGGGGAAAGRREGRSALVPLAAALVLAGAAVLVPWRGLQRARAVPPIHDITTDTEDPPVFVAVLPLRTGAPNPAVYGGDSVAALQRKGYPDLRPLRVAAPPATAYARALATAREMKWEVVAVDSVAGRIEATATTPWFGFHDDVVVRLRPDGTGTRVDVRSVSRVGGSDVGTNAARIRAYLARVAHT
jgi:uncharacterized protein (DUF1499 family)